jgi:multimeric flavodoxin WrbA
MTGESGGKKRVLGIIGSQRKLGNCELFVKETARHVPGCELSLVRLPALDIRPCKGCYRCLDEGICPTGDDVVFLKDLIAEADALIIASPVYFLGAHGSVKMLLDRAFSFFSVIERTRDKPAILAVTYGLDDRIGTAPQTLLTLAAFLGLSVKASVSLKAALPGEVLTKNHLRTAEKLGRGLFGPGKTARQARACPFCGNDIVRVRKEDFICTVCHGSFQIGEKRAVKGAPGWDVGDTGFVRDHREWLKGMKERFMAARKKIVRLTAPYKEMGRWVGPDRATGE